MTRVATIVLVLIAAAAAVLLNVLLLGQTGSAGDPVGKLRARAHLPAAPPSTIRPRTGLLERDHRDD